MKKCIACGLDVSRHLEHYRDWRGGIWICLSNGLSSNNDYFSAYDTYEAVVFHSETIYRVYWFLKKPGWSKEILQSIETVDGGTTSSFSLSLDSTPGEYKVVAEFFYGKPFETISYFGGSYHTITKYKSTTYEHTFTVY